jgi:betaine-aldehyde dehydrogenase
MIPAVTDHLLIDGRLGPGHGDPFDVINPATGQAHATLRAADMSQLGAATSAAARAQPGWQALAQPERTRRLLAISEAIEANRDRLAEALTYETGRPLTRNHLYVDMARDIFRQYAELARALGGRIAPSNDPGQLSLVIKAPYGVVGCLIPWNYPLLLLVFKVAPALAVGNTVVIKPASETPLSLQVLAEVFAEHLPPGVANTVMGPGRTIGEGLVIDPLVDMVAFTGSTEVGRRLGVLCAEAVKPSHLELGGKDPAIVFDDVDPNVAAEGVVWASFLNAGQVCTSTERVYVHRSLHDEFVDRAVAITKGIRLGDPFEETTQVGPMRSESRRRSVLEMVDRARDSGGRVVAGGAALERPGFFVEPTVVVDVNHEMELMREETFGPVMPIMAFDDDDEAFRLAADTPYGLGASLYTSSPTRVERAYRELRVGTVWVNDPVVDNLAAPFGGVRASGNARELGVEALDSFTNARHVHWNLELVPKPWWFREE